MRAILSSQGQVFLIFMILLIVLSALISTPLMIIFALLGLSYLFSYPIVVRNFPSPDVSIVARMRNSLMFRNEVEILHIEITNNTKTVIPFLQVDIQVPNQVYFVESANTYSFSLKPGETRVLNVAIMATARGSFSLGPIHLYISDSLGLFKSLLHRIDQVSIRVFPRRLGKKVSKADAKLIFSKLVGIYSIQMKGLGTDFHGLRDYIRGDPSKIVYWPATAKHDRLISKEFEQERRLDVYVIVQGGATMRGPKFDFCLGMSMDLYEGIVAEHQPCGYIFYDDRVRVHYNPSTSPRQKMKIWSSIYDIQPRDTYPNYKELINHLLKNKISNSLLIFLGDLESSTQQLLEVMRKSIINKNNVIFLDVWGYNFSYKQQLIDASADFGGTKYGYYLHDIIGKNIEHEEVFQGLYFKTDLHRLGGTYGYLASANDNVVRALERALYARHGGRWRMMA